MSVAETGETSGTSNLIDKLVVKYSGQAQLLKFVQVGESLAEKGSKLFGVAYVANSVNNNRTLTQVEASTTTLH